MQPTKEAQAFIKALSVYDDFHHIGRELAVSVDATQAQHFVELVSGYATVRVILHEDN